MPLLDDQERQRVDLGALREEAIERPRVNIDSLRQTERQETQRQPVDLDNLREEEDARESNLMLSHDSDFLTAFIRDVGRVSTSLAASTNPAFGMFAQGINQKPETRFGNAANALISGFSTTVKNLITSGVVGISQVDRRYSPARILARVIKGDHSIEDFTPFERALYEMGQQTQRDLDRLFPENEEMQGEFIASALPRMAGSMAAQVGGGLIAGPGRAAAFISAGITGISFSGSEFEQAFEETGDANLATMTFLANLPINSIPIKLQLGQFFNRLNKVTNGGLTKHLKGNYANRLQDLTTTPAAAAVAGGFEGAVTNIVQEFGVNAVAGATYDEARNFSDGLVEAGAASALIGFAMNAFGISMAQQKLRKDLTPTKRAEITEAKKHTDKVIEELGPEALDLVNEFRRGPDPVFNKRVQKLREDINGKKISKKHAEEEIARLERDLMDMPNADAFYQHLDSVENTRAMLEGTPSGEFPLMGEGIRPKSIDSQSTMLFDTKGFKGKAEKKFKDFISAWFTPKGRFPKEVYQRLLQKGDLQDKYTQDAVFNVRGLIDGIRKDFGVKGDIFDPNLFPRRTMMRINEALNGDTKVLADLPQRTRDGVIKMRESIDNLSRLMIEEGVVGGDLALILESNLGTYLNRTYKIFHPDPKIREQWVNNVPTDVRNRAESAIRDIFRMRKVEVSKQRVDDIINKILYQGESPLFVLSKIGDKKKDLHTVKLRDDIFKRKHEIPEAIRALMGEELQPFVNYTNSVQKMANVLSEYRFYDDLSKNFEGTLFSKNVDHKKGHITEFEPVASGVELPLKSIYTTPDIAQAFRDAYHPVKTGNFLRGYMALNAVTKYAKTTLSVATHGRNIIGGNLMMLTAGHIPTATHYKTALKAVSATLKGVPDADLRAQVLRYRELGLLDKDVRAGELRDILKDIGIKEAAFFGDAFDHFKAKGTSIYAKAKMPAELMTRLYQAEDNVIRIAFFEAELARYRKADPDVSERFVANLVKDTYQDYSQVGAATKLLRRFPLIGPFVAFPHEVIRTSINNAHQARVEMKSSNPEIRKIGYQRLAGLTFAAIGTTAASIATRYMFGISEQDDADARLFDAEWNRNAEKLYLGKDGDGRVSSINLSYIDPYALLKEPLLALARNDDKDFDEKMTEAMRSFFSPFINEEILAQKLREVITNDKVVGGRVFNPEDTQGNRWSTIFSHIWDGFEPGTITSARNLYSSLDPEKAEDAKDFPEELLAMFGMRVVTTDVKRSFPFDVREYHSNIRDIRGLTRNLGTSDIMTDEGREIITRAQDTERDANRRMTEQIRAGKRLGVSREELLRIASESGMSKKQFEELEFNISLPQGQHELFMQRYEQEMRSLRNR